jgi:hypothetical protein
LNQIAQELRTVSKWYINDQKPNNDSSMNRQTGPGWTKLPEFWNKNEWIKFHPWHCPQVTFVLLLLLHPPPPRAFTGLCGLH